VIKEERGHGGGKRHGRKVPRSTKRWAGEEDLKERGKDRGQREIDNPGGGRGTTQRRSFSARMESPERKWLYLRAMEQNEKDS